MAKIELTNMVMIQNKKTGQVVVQDRTKNYCGIAFPGGHIENNESIHASAIREIKEETGLDIWNLKFCGFVHWYNNHSNDRNITYCYKTSDFSGNMLTKTEEGKVFWANLTDFSPERLAPNMDIYLQIFNNGNFTEIYCSSNENEPKKIVYL